MKPKYNCTIDELYEICRTGWQSFLDNLAAFTDFSLGYTAPLAVTRNTAIDTAEAAPDDPARDADHVVKRVGLENQAKACLKLWRQLARYIVKAYADSSIQKARLAEAGQNDYERAADNNWEKVKSVLLSGKSFMALHSADLLANNNMPVGFPAIYNAARGVFLPLLTAFITSESGTAIGTDAKIALNNAIFDDLMHMLDDGKFIFEDDEARTGLFTFVNIKNLISSPGAAGANMTMVDSVTFEPIADGTFTLQLPAAPAVSLQTDTDGFCRFNNLPAGTYTVTALKATYVTQSFTMVISTGVHSRRKILLVKV